MHKGSDWIKSQSWSPENMSPLGEKVADLLGDVFSGIYHLNTTSLKKAEWDTPYVIEISLGWQYLSTYDNNLLTVLVVLCHDRMIRCSIAARTYQYFELMFHQRSREGGFSERHPTIEQAIEQIRLRHPEVTNETIS